jgi:hypothetical protein
MVKKTKPYAFEHQQEEQQQITPEIRIVSVTTQKELKDFYAVPRTVYKDDPCWVPSFWAELEEFFAQDNPFWNHATTRLFIAYHGNQPAGRIAGFIDETYIKSTSEDVGFFGFFECINDPTIASALLHCVEEWLLSVKNISKMRGPIQGRIDEGCGFLTEGFDIIPSVLSSYSPRYYLDFMERYGMKAHRELLVYFIDLRGQIPEELESRAQRCRASGVQIRRFNLKQLEQELQWWIPLFQEVFADHWGYVPVSEAEVKASFGIRPLRKKIDPDLFFVAEMNQEPIGFLWSTPDYNQVFRKMDGTRGLTDRIRFLLCKRRITKGKFHYVGVKKEYRKSDVSSLLNYDAIEEMKRRGYSSAECGWIDALNIHSRKSIEKTGGTITKRFRVFEKRIAQRKITDLNPQKRHSLTRPK